MNIEKVTKINFTEEEKEIMEKCQEVLNEVCDRIKIVDCENDCPFYRFCINNGPSILDGVIALANNATEIYTD